MIDSSSRLLYFLNDYFNVNIFDTDSNIDDFYNYNAYDYGVYDIFYNHYNLDYNNIISLQLLLLPLQRHRRQ